jgi:hypothetical protein
MVGKRGVLLFETEDELDVLMQFILNELLQDGRPIIQHYLETRGPARNAMEEEPFHGIRNSFSSLFRVQRVRPDGIVLENLLMPSQELHTLVDIGLIQTGAAGFLLFTRLVPLREYAITAGVSFPFEGSQEEALIAEARSAKKLGREDEVGMRWYVLFHPLSKSKGLQVEFEEPGDPFNEGLPDS